MQTKTGSKTKLAVAAGLLVLATGAAYGAYNMGADMYSSISVRCADGTNVTSAEYNGKGMGCAEKQAWVPVARSMCQQVTGKDVINKIFYKDACRPYSAN